MLLSIPVLATEQKQPDQPAPVVAVRPLFALQPIEQGASLQRALAKLGSKLRENYDEIGKRARHDALARLTFAPHLSTKILQFRLFLSSQTFDCKYLFVQFDAFGKRIAHTPNVPQVWFEIERGEDLQTRAIEVLTEHFKTLERRDGKNSQNPAAHSFPSKAFVTTLDLNLNLPQKYEPPKNDLLAMLGGGEQMDGARELRRVGRCLDWLYPNDLERAVGRENEARELTRLLESKDKRPVVVVGKSQVGKTNLLHEYVFGQIARRKQNRAGERLVWLVSPPRLISGMSFVGQWENRLTAILREVEARGHLLYFDDLLGLFTAGVSASSDLNVAQVLKPYLERRDVRVVAEVTPETWRVVQERDRSFAELFHVFRLDETDEDETLKILLAVRRELEHQFGCRFDLDALPTALDLPRRYRRESSFPGKAASFLKQIANKFANAAITRADVLREFEAKSGLRVAFLDDRSKLERAEIVEKIAENVIGQRAAIEAAADVVSIAKARLNDTHRPLASFLFLGATGVGKTEAAKQTARYLYGDGEKLLRFDMNEFVSAFDVARLVGTFDQPEGLLTSAIRREPFAVVLLDEIEKAHSDVFNLLLQVLGDGRLTDAHGRTADFSNAIVILTSNLGAREAHVKLGFRETNESNASVYRQAAERFFRPEFFNRLDRIIAFENLRRADVERIARIQMQRVFAREGFARRNCRIEIEPAAMRKIVDEGYDPQMGARALKRAVEKNLIQPVAARLAALKSSAPTIIKVGQDGEKLTTGVEEIKPLAAAKSVWTTRDFSDAAAELDKIEDALNRIEDAIDHLKPRNEIAPHDERQARYFLVMEYVRRVERMIERADGWKQSKVSSPKSKAQRQLVSLREAGVDLAEILSDANLAARLKEMASENRAFGETAADYAQDIWRETALLEAVTANLEKPLTAQTVMAFRAADSSFGKAAIPDLRARYEKLFAQELGLKVSAFEPDSGDADYFEMFLLLEGAFAFDLANAEAGNHVFVSRRGDFAPIEIAAFEIGRNQTPKDFPEIRREISGGKSHGDFGVVRIYNERGNALDFRCGLLTREKLSFRELRTFVLSGLKLPVEISEPAGA